MKRFLDLTDRLDVELDKAIDIFLEQRPWLLGEDAEPAIIDRSDVEIERKVENDIAISEIAERIQHEAYK